MMYHEASGAGTLLEVLPGEVSSWIDLSHQRLKNKGAPPFA
jgi:hypothetical protein